VIQTADRASACYILCKMNISKHQFGTILGVSIASLYSLYYASTASQWHFIDYADLIFHEAGHVIFMFFGEFISVCMGSGLQILLPFSIAVYFLYHRQKISGTICLMWTGMNLINVSVYAHDAIAMQLPLLGGDNVVHDWNYILSMLNILHSAPVVAATLYALGIFTIGVGITYGFIFALKYKL
jgi:hypothetical protein